MTITVELDEQEVRTLRTALCIMLVDVRKLESDEEAMLGRKLVKNLLDKIK